MWKVSLNKDGICHVFPLDDLQQHITQVQRIRSKKKFVYRCNCKCKPTFEYIENGRIIVKHSSFDGREALEWANEILKNKNS
jgi:hypothetical protein